MASAQTLKLLDALLAGSSGEEKERLAALYKQAYGGTESFKRLKDLLEGCEFYGTVGQELLTKGEDVIQEGFSQAGNFGDQFTVMDYVVDKIQQELDAATQHIRSANVADSALHVLDRRFAHSATKYYEMLFHYVCSLFGALYGDGILKNMKVKAGIRSADLVRNLNEELSSLVAEGYRQSAPKGWRIVRKHFSGFNMVSYRGFVLEYGGITVDYLRDKCEMISPLVFRDTTDPSVLCCGIGYLTSLDETDGGRVYDGQIISKPALNCLDNYDIDYDSLNIRMLLNTLAGSDVCIIDPKDLVELMNRYFMVKTARENRAKGCMYCGKGNCRHFNIPKVFG